MWYRFRKLLIFFYFHYGVWMEKHLSTERLVPRPAAGPGRVARLGRGPLSWCVHSNDVAGYHQHRPGTIMGSHKTGWKFFMVWLWWCMLYTYSVWLLMDVHLSECEQSSLHTKVAGLSRDRPHQLPSARLIFWTQGQGATAQLLLHL